MQLERFRNIELRGAYLELWRIGGPLVVDHGLELIDISGVAEVAARSARIRPSS